MSFAAIQQRVWVLVFTCLAGAGNARAADLALETLKSPFGSSVAVQVRVLDPSGQTAALQFDLDHPSSLSFAGSPGLAAFDGGKSLYSHTLSASRTRFLVVGMNSTPIPEGVLVSLAATVGAGTPPGNYAIAVRDAMGSDPGGEASPISGSEAQFSVGEATASPPGLITHLAVGGGWKTTVSLYNPSPESVPVRIASWDGSGSPMAIPWTVPPGDPAAETGTPLQWTIHPNGTLDLVADDAASSAATVGWAQLFTPANVSAWVTYTLNLPSGLQSETTYPVERRSAVSLVLPFDNSTDLSTSVAVANGSESNASDVLVVARDREGRHLFSDLLRLPLRGHTSFAVAEKYPALNGLRGTLEFQNTREGAIAVIGVRMRATGAVSAVSPTFRD
jgi:hypothetical protein